MEVQNAASLVELKLEDTLKILKILGFCDSESFGLNLIRSATLLCGEASTSLVTVSESFQVPLTLGRDS